MYVSSSQLDTFAACPRKWWFEKVQGMLPARSGSEATAFGTVLHGVIERWLLSDSGTVDLYPYGWARDPQSGIELDEDQQNLVKDLVRKGIEEGVLIRQPDRQVEYRFARELIPGRVALIGIVDLRLSTQIEDHKSVKEMRYAKTLRRDASEERRLDHNRQILLYCKSLPDDLPEIRIAHNVFSRTEERVKKVGPVKVSRERIEQNWKECQDLARRMLELVERRLPLVRWDQVEGAYGDPDNDACNAYGGCPYLRVCSRRESTADFQERQERLRMDFLERARAAKAKQKADASPFKALDSTPTPSEALPPLEPADRAAAAAQPPVPTPPEAPPEAPTPPEAPAPAPAPAQPDAPVIVLCNCAPVYKQALSGDSLLDQVLAREDMTYERFLELDKWDRLQRLELAARKHLPELIKGQVVVFVGKDSLELQTLLRVARQHADWFFTGVV